MFSAASDGEHLSLDNRMACPLCLQDVVGTFTRSLASGKRNLLVTSQQLNNSMTNCSVQNAAATPAAPSML